MELTNDDLFLLAWHAPMTRIAAAIGVSDVALKKTCRNRGIPTPPRGYWAKVQAGLSVPRPPKPSWGRSAPSLILEAHSETVLSEMLRSARTSSAVIPDSQGQGDLTELSGASPSLRRSATASSATTSSVASQSELLPPIALVDFESFRIHECRERALGRIEERSAELSTGERLRVKVWIAQARLEIERSDPARALLSRLLGAQE